MIAVADTSPLNYLLLIGCADVLPQLYERVLIPQAVYDELRSAGAPEAVRSWATALPSWVETRASEAPVELNPELDAGEREAISLALEVRAAAVLLDERAGRRAALEHGLTITGTLGVLEEAARRGLVDLAEVVAQLRRTNFRASPALWKRLADGQ